jgi:hypothetical protein
MVDGSNADRTSIVSIADIFIVLWKDKNLINSKLKFWHFLGAVKMDTRRPGSNTGFRPNEISIHHQRTHQHAKKLSQNRLPQSHSP